MVWNLLSNVLFPQMLFEIILWYTKMLKMNVEGNFKAVHLNYKSTIEQKKIKRNKKVYLL